jgi:hypothetical protein
LGFGVLGFGVWGLGQSPIPNILIQLEKIYRIIIIIKIKLVNIRINK